VNEIIKPWVLYVAREFEETGDMSYASATVKVEPVYEPEGYYSSESEASIQGKLVVQQRGVLAVKWVKLDL